MSAAVAIPTTSEAVRRLPPDQLWNLEEQAVEVASLAREALDDWFVAQFGAPRTKTVREIARETKRNHSNVVRRIRRLEHEGRIDPNRPKDARGGPRRVAPAPDPENDATGEVVDAEVVDDDEGLSPSIRAALEPRDESPTEASPTPSKTEQRKADQAATAAAKDVRGVLNKLAGITMHMEGIDTTLIVTTKEEKAEWLSQMQAAVSRHQGFVRRLRAVTEATP